MIIPSRISTLTFGQERTYSTQQFTIKLLEEPLTIKIFLANALEAT